jgi:hypothetical protein
MFTRCLVHTAGNSPRASRDGKECIDTPFAPSYGKPEALAASTIGRAIPVLANVVLASLLPLPATAHILVPARRLRYSFSFVTWSARLHRFCPSEWARVVHVRLMVDHRPMVGFELLALAFDPLLAFARVEVV